MKRPRGTAISFCTSYILLLQRHSLLYYSTKELRWCWDMTSIRGQTDLAGNVAAAVVEHIHDLDPTTQKLLLDGSDGVQFEQVLARVAYSAAEETAKGWQWRREDEQTSPGPLTRISSSRRSMTWRAQRIREW
uniref:Uncharacterized protein n=1 Tax=Grammatophora oceanica TaxID=210454 RepID=A0A7S1VDA2_9STRA|mmetsp:Transcript_43505/g.64557  ORF Transcript_43505/g.64557 Transcript_43505/m.64557 type:complete len:133 (+) Transcript_43505:237-635(+)